MTELCSFVDDLVRLDILDQTAIESLSIHMTQNYIEMKIAIGESASSQFSEKFTRISWKQTFLSEHEWYNVEFDKSHHRVYCYFGLSSIQSVLKYIMEFVEKYFSNSSFEREGDYTLFNGISDYIKMDSKLSISIFYYHLVSWIVEINYLDTILEDSHHVPYFIYEHFPDAEFWILRNYIEIGNCSVLLGEASKNQINNLLVEVGKVMKKAYADFH